MSWARMRQQGAAELTTAFASRHPHAISLSDALKLHVIAGYSRRAPGETYLIDPSLDGSCD